MAATSASGVRPVRHEHGRSAGGARTHGSGRELTVEVVDAEQTHRNGRRGLPARTSPEYASQRLRALSQLDEEIV